MRWDALRTDRSIELCLEVSLLAVMLVLTGCAAPISVSRLNMNETYQQLSRSALSGDVPSESTEIVLRRYGLLATWKKDPDAAIAALRGDVVNQPASWADLFALAELSYLQAKLSGSKADFLAAALYAYAYLNPGDTAEQPSPYDEHFRQASDIYNLGLTGAFSSEEQNGATAIVSGPRQLPFGVINLVTTQSPFQWHGLNLVDFEPTINLSVSGLQNVYRNTGLGEPLAAQVQASSDTGQKNSKSLLIPPKLRVPTNLMLIIDHPRRQIAHSVLHGTLDIHTFYNRKTMQIGQQTVPLEYNPSATWALSLVETTPWSSEFESFFNGERFETNQGQLVTLEPHEFGRMPVILIHGTASSAFRWADMVNELLQNPTIDKHFEFWFFSYGSGNPIPYSALQLREAIEGAVAQLGGVKADPALGQITLIGHSQGGLLAKMMVVDPGDRLWNGMGFPPFSSLKLSNSSRKLLHDAMFPTPLPEVRRVIFIATPHRGSYLASFSVSGLVNALVTLPLAITRIGAEISGGSGYKIALGQTRVRLGSISGMSSNSPFIRSLAAIPVVPGIHVHSIIPVATSGPIAEGKDGVVAYSSAHISPVESELVVHSGHSTQSNPATIAEVQRILLLQLESLPPTLDQAPGPDAQ